MGQSKTNVELKVGEDYTLRLKGLGTAGYDWNWTITGNAKAVEVTREISRQPILQKDETAKPLEPPQTSSVIDIFRIHAIQTGVATIHFIQTRSWEKDNRPPINENVLEITIRD